jgi:hypothetical protein
LSERAKAGSRLGAAARRLALALGALGASACTNFPDVSTVTDLRVLAVTTDPPDMFLTVTGLPADRSVPPDISALGIDQGSIQVIHVTPLLADPPAAADGRAVTWTLSACPNDPYGASPPNSVMGGAMDPGGGANNTVGSTLCDDARVILPPIPGTYAKGDTADVQLTSDELLTAFKTDVYFDQFGHPHGGFDLGMPLNLQLTATDGVVTTKAVKRVVFWAHTWPDQTPNQIPALPGVSLFAHREDSTFELTDPAGMLDAQTRTHDATPTHVALDVGMWLLPDYQEGVTAEMYGATIINRDPPYQVIESPMPVQERIRYAFYATAGHFDPARTVNQLIPGTQGTVHLESHYIPPGTLDGVPADATGLHIVTVWVVVSDDRGGETWLEGRLALDPPAP